jgi:hypothetical protein
MKAYHYLKSTNLTYFETTSRGSLNPENLLNTRFISEFSETKM